MPFATKGKNNMLGGLGATYASLHDNVPNDSGSNEISGGSPAYARKSVTFNTAASGSMTVSNSPVFDVPAGKTIYYMGLWDASTSGNFLGFQPINGGTIRLGATVLASSDVFTSYAHGLVDNDVIALQTIINGSIPTGLSTTTLYYVVSSATDTFKVSLTQGGSAVNVTTDGEAWWQKVIPQAFSIQGTLTLNSSTWSLNGFNY